MLRLPPPATAAAVPFHSKLQFSPRPSLLKPLTVTRCLPASTALDGGGSLSPPVVRKRKRYRKQHPGEAEGIVEEMRFVAMRLRKGTDGGGGGEQGANWVPSLEGLVKYLVNSKLVFDTVEQIIDESTDVAYVYFRNCGLERSSSLSKDLEWFREQEIVIPEPSAPGLTYASYLRDLADDSASSFLCHYYNIYFAHITGGVAIGRKVCEKLLDEKELEFYRWDDDVEVLLKDVREKLNRLSMPWTRDQKNKCLKEATKSFRSCGQIIRLIIS